MTHTPHPADAAAARLADLVAGESYEVRLVTHSLLAADISTLLEARASDRAEIERLRAALKPFAGYRGSDPFLASDASDDGLCASVRFTAGDYRRARAALNRLDDEPKRMGGE